VKHWLIIAAALALTPFAAHPEDAGPRIEQAWARATPGSAELHAHENDHGVMHMHPVDGVAVQPGSPTVLKPGGVHVMLMQLKHPLKVGDTFPLTLRFAKAGDREVTVHVEKPGAAGPRQGS
jgi:copper(I)-binding protein